jgi:hypothetical protein
VRPQAACAAHRQRRLNSRCTARMRVFSTTTPRRTALSRTVSSSGATRRLWRWLGPFSSRGECLLSSGEAVVTAVYILNRSHTKALNGRTSYKAWHGRKPAVSHLRVFGCLAFGKELSHIGKLDDMSTTGVFIGYEEGSKAYRILDPGTQRVRTTRDVVFDEGRGWAWDKPVDDGSTPTYDNFTVEYVHFERVGGVGSSLPPSMSIPVPEPLPTSAPRSLATTSVATRSSPPPPPPHPVPPCTPTATATPPGTSTPTPTRVENSVEFATPLSHDEERINAYHDGEPLRYRTMENLLGDQPVLGLAPHDLEAQLHLACDNGDASVIRRGRETCGMACRDVVEDGRN